MLSSWAHCCAQLDRRQREVTVTTEHGEAAGAAVWTTAGIAVAQKYLLEWIV
jgi:hypothetical protein